MLLDKLKILSTLSLPSFDLSYDFHSGFRLKKYTQILLFSNDRLKSQNVLFPGCLFRYPMQLLLLSTMHNCLIYLWIIKNKRIFKNNYNALNTLASGALNFLGRPKNHILNVRSQSFRKKIPCINVYGNIIFPDFKYIYAYRTIFLGAHFENFVIPIIC